MEFIGVTLKQIRESLSLTQQEMSVDIMSQSNYSKVENGDIDISFSKMVEVLNRIGMSVDEFLYIHQDYTKNPGSQLNKLNNLVTNDERKISQYINEFHEIAKPTTREKELLAIYEALCLISKNDFEVAKEKATIVWKRLEKHDNWYIYDIQLISNILFIFPIDVAESIVSLALKRLKIYQNLRGVNKLSNNLRLNFSLLLIKNKKYQTALDRLNRIIVISKEKNLYLHLAASYVRKGILLHILENQDPSEWYKKGFDLLEATDSHVLIGQLKQEIKNYTKQ